MIDPTGLFAYNAERTERTADNALNSSAPDIKYNEKDAKAVIDSRRKFTKPVRGGEPVGVVNKDGEVETRKADSRDSTRTGGTASFTPKKSDKAVIHGHISGSFTDDPKSNNGLGDASSLKINKPNFVVERNRVAVRDSPKGVLRIKVLKGRLTKKEAKQI